MWNPEATIRENRAVLFVAPTFPLHIRKRHFLKIDFELKRRNTDISRDIQRKERVY